MSVKKFGNCVKTTKVKIQISSFLSISIKQWKQNYSKFIHVSKYFFFLEAEFALFLVQLQRPKRLVHTDLSQLLTSSQNKEYIQRSVLYKVIVNWQSRSYVVLVLKSYSGQKVKQNASSTSMHMEMYTIRQRGRVWCQQQPFAQASKCEVNMSALN